MASSPAGHAESVPHVEVAEEIAPEEPAIELPAAPKRNGLLIGLGAAVVVLLAAGGFFAWRAFFPPSPPPRPAPIATKPKPVAPVVAKPTPPPAASTTQPPVVAPKPAAIPEKAPAESAPTPSATMNAFAHAPAKAINRTRETTAAQAAGARATNEVLNDPADPPPVTPSTTVADPKPAATVTATAVTELAPGVSATSRLYASPEASAAFRSFVANMKISGVMTGSQPKALINGKLVHAGAVIDATLGIVFEGIKGDQLVFKDQSGVTVTRRRP